MTLFTVKKVLEIPIFFLIFFLVLRSSSYYVIKIYGGKSRMAWDSMQKKCNLLCCVHMHRHKRHSNGIFILVYFSSKHPTREHRVGVLLSCKILHKGRDMRSFSFIKKKRWKKCSAWLKMEVTKPQCFICPQYNSSPSLSFLQSVPY